MVMNEAHRAEKEPLKGDRRAERPHATAYLLIILIISYPYQVHKECDIQDRHLLVLCP